MIEPGVAYLTEQCIQSLREYVFEHLQCIAESFAQNEAAEAAFEATEAAFEAALDTQIL